jgi:hypothetical protein
MSKKLSFTVFKNHDDCRKHDHDYWLSQSPEDRLNEVELLRLEAGKFSFYEYPARLRRIVKVIRRTPC